MRRPLGMVQVVAYFTIIGAATIAAVAAGVVVGVLAIASLADEDAAGYSRPAVPTVT